MVTLGEGVRWLAYTLSGLYQRLAARVLRRDQLVAGSERRFRALLEAAPDAIVIVDRHGHIALINAQAERLFGYARAEIVGQNVTELIPERYRAQHREHEKGYRRDARVREMGSDLELFARRKDGTEIPIAVSLSPLPTDQGLLVTSVIRDVTYRKQIEAELKRRANELERSNADLERFASVASHDLSAPLRLVGGFVELLGRRYEGKLDAEADEYIAQSLQGVRRMQRMIDDLLAYSRVSGDAGELEPVDTAAIVRSVLATFSDPIAEAHAEVTVGELPTVQGRPSQLEQVFQNLIGNALKFTNSSTPTVDVAAAHEGTEWRFSVRDNGIGIDASETEEIFQMFRRLNRADDYPGSGIGLAICKRIVEHHGGEIGAQPAAGGGTILWFTLPGATATKGI